MPQPPQFSGSDEVSTQSVPQAVCVPEQVVPTIPPVPVVPPVPVEPPKVAFEQAAVRAAMLSPKIKARALVMTRRFPPGAKAIPRTMPFATRSGREWHPRTMHLGSQLRPRILGLRLSFMAGTPARLLELLRL